MDLMYFNAKHIVRSKPNLAMANFGSSVVAALQLALPYSVKRGGPHFILETYIHIMDAVQPHKKAFSTTDCLI